MHTHQPTRAHTLSQAIHSTHAPEYAMCAALCAILYLFILMAMYYFNSMADWYIHIILIKHLYIQY